jgi:1-aminocyclopropane-1-carboxylate deaminase/D-cysteine desulfhydrase-like pyridoxal-dependent ACC family enzyme
VAVRVGSLSAEERLERSAALHEAAAEELERAARHCRTAAAHFRDHQVPRGAAHALAALGHVRAAEESLDEQARIHASASRA